MFAHALEMTPAHAGIASVYHIINGHHMTSVGLLHSQLTRTVSMSSLLRMAAELHT